MDSAAPLSVFLLPIRLRFVEVCGKMTHTYSHEDKTYDVFKLWELAEGLLTQELGIEALDWHDYMQAKCWSGDKSPAEILETSDDTRGHMERIRQADLNYPIIIAPNWGIADGMHRIAKALYEGQESIQFKKFESWEQMEPALIKQESEDDR